MQRRVGRFPFAGAPRCRGFLTAGIYSAKLWQVGKLVPGSQERGSEPQRRQRRAEEGRRLWAQVRRGEMAVSPNPWDRAASKHGR